MEKKKKSFSLKGDKVIWMIFLLLCVISIIEVFSASSILSYRTGDYLSPVIKHAGLLALGVIMAFFTMGVPCKYFQAGSLILYFLSLILLVSTFFFASETNGANRWIPIFGINFQPSEMAKGSLVLVVANLLSMRFKQEFFKYKAFKYILLFSTPIVLLILFENFSTAALLALVIFLMMIIGKIPAQQILKLVAFGVALVAMFLGLLFIVPEEDAGKEMTDNVELVAEASLEEVQEKEDRGFMDKILHRVPTWRNRIMSFVDQDSLKVEDIDLDADAQWAHSNIAIASSKGIGKGPGNSTERDFLPQAFSDFIYAIIVEEMGIVGAVLVCFLYIFLLFRTATIANRCASTFPALLIMGLALLIVVQAMFNMLVSVGAVPVTGQPLPLISKGGTSSIINCIYIGIIQSVSISAKKKITEEKVVVQEAV